MSRSPRPELFTLCHTGHVEVVGCDPGPYAEMFSMRLEDALGPQPGRQEMS